jgi:hypothetical protein
LALIFDNEPQLAGAAVWDAVAGSRERESALCPIRF